MDAEIKKTLWAAADKLRSNMDAAKYKHLVLGLVFLKYISDAFDERRNELKKAACDLKSDVNSPTASDRDLLCEDRDPYAMTNILPGSPLCPMGADPESGEAARHRQADR